MAITDITKKVARLEAMERDQILQNRIDALSPERAIFALKALLLADHVSAHVMESTLNLAFTLRDNV